LLRSWRGALGLPQWRRCSRLPAREMCRIRSPTSPGRPRFLDTSPTPDSKTGLIKRCVGIPRSLRQHAVAQARGASHDPGPRVSGGTLGIAAARAPHWVPFQGPILALEATYGLWTGVSSFKARDFEVCVHLRTMGLPDEADAIGSGLTQIRK